MSVDLADLEAVSRPIEQARGLPNACYTDEAVFAREREQIFARTWSAIGFGQDVVRAGDARPVDFLGMPLVMLRDEAGAVRVFHNVCRHRGMVLVAEAGNLGRVVVGRLHVGSQMLGQPEPARANLQHAMMGFESALLDIVEPPAPQCVHLAVFMGQVLARTGVGGIGD